MTSHMFLIFLSLAKSYAVTANDILQCSQAWGQPRINLTIDGNQFNINGVKYDDGFGTHASSMLPIDVPTAANKFTGLVGVDNEASGNPHLKFHIYSGSEELWGSQEFTKYETPAENFEVTIPVGVKKLYLFTEQLNDNNDYCHADWVNLRFSNGERIGNTHDAVIYGKHYGLKPNSDEDSGEKIRQMITEARKTPGSTILLDKGVYHFYQKSALKMRFHVTNHDQPTFHHVSIPLIDLDGVTLDGSGSTFLFHGLHIPLTVMDSKNVAVKHVHLDYNRTFYTESFVTETGLIDTIVQINTTRYPFHISGTWFVFEGDDWTLGCDTMMAFEGETKHIIAGTSDISWSRVAHDRGSGVVDLVYNSKYMKKGDVLVLKANDRPHPAFFVNRAINTVLDDVSIHSSEGMALIVQRSENITMTGGGVYIPVDSNRYHTSGADATHFSTTRGVITVENAVFEGMMDDAINVHSICLQIKEIYNKTSFKVEFKHYQAVGFDVFYPGETLRFIHASALQLDDATAKVVSVTRLTTELLDIVIDREIPDSIGGGDAVENGDYYPEVVFRGNLVQNNRARGSLFTTPKRVLVENNTFSHVAGSAILFAGDAAGWFESGNCEEVIVRNNKFIDCLTSTFQFTEAVIVSYPTINNLGRQTKKYHRNIHIVDNYFESFDVPLLYAISTENLDFMNNKVIYNDHYPSWGRKPFNFNKCGNVTISKNDVSPAKTWTISDVDYSNMDKEEIHVD